MEPKVSATVTDQGIGRGLTTPFLFHAARGPDAPLIPRHIRTRVRRGPAKGRARVQYVNRLKVARQVAIVESWSHLTFS